MTIKKLGHCCLLIKVNDATILTDPGMFSTSQNDLTGINAVVITHEHGDHLHIDSMKAIVKNNPSAAIITNSGVGKQLDAAGIPHQVVEGTAKTSVKGVEIEAFDCKHEEIFEEYGQVQNTGYFIGGELFYPGDSFGTPQREIKTLALPVAGPWCRLPDAIRYAIRMKPQKAFPVHDAVIVKGFRGFASQIVTEILKKHNTAFTHLDENDEAEF